MTVTITLLANHFLEDKGNPLKPCGSRGFLVDDTGLEPVTSRTSIIYGLFFRLSQIDFP